MTVYFDDEALEMRPFRVVQIHARTAADPSFSCHTKKCKHKSMWIVEEINDYDIKHLFGLCDSCRSKFKHRASATKD